MYNVLVYPVLRLKLDKLGEKRPSLVNSDFTIAGHFPQLLVECKSRKEMQPNRDQSSSTQGLIVTYISNGDLGQKWRDSNLT